MSHEEHDSQHVGAFKPGGLIVELKWWRLRGDGGVYRVDSSQCSGRWFRMPDPVRGPWSCRASFKKLIRADLSQLVVHHGRGVALKFERFQWGRSLSRPPNRISVNHLGSGAALKRRV